MVRRHPVCNRYIGWYYIHQCCTPISMVKSGPTLGMHHYWLNWMLLGQRWSGEEIYNLQNDRAEETGKEPFDEQIIRSVGTKLESVMAFWLPGRRLFLPFSSYRWRSKTWCRVLTRNTRYQLVVHKCYLRYLLHCVCRALRDCSHSILSCLWWCLLLFSFLKIFTSFF